MQKFLGYLVAKLKELGATIVYASTSKLIICTKKYSKKSAQNYTEFILKTLVSYPLFQYLIINPVKYWKVLLFKDNYNYTGIPEQEDEESNEIDIAYQWQIVEVLPPKIEEYFLSLIGEYVLTIHQQIVENQSQLAQQA